MTRKAIWFGLVMTFVCFSFYGVATAQEDTAGQQDDVQESAAENQYDAASPTTDGLEEACPTADEVGRLSADGDSPRFDVGDNQFVLIRTSYEPERPSNPTMTLDLYKNNNFPDDSAEVGPEAGTYDTRFNATPGSYYVQATQFGAAFESIIYVCTGNGGGSSGEIGEGGNDEREDEAMEGTYDEGKELVYTGGPSLLVPASALLVAGGLLGFSVLRVRR